MASLQRDDLSRADQLAWAYTLIKTMRALNALDLDWDGPRTCAA